MLKRFMFRYFSAGRAPGNTRAGEHDLFVKLITDDTLRLNELLHEMDKIPGISSTRTIVVLKTEKETNAITLG